MITYKLIIVRNKMLYITCSNVDNMKSKPQPELEYKDSQPIISRLSSSCVYLNINLSSVY